MSSPRRPAVVQAFPIATRTPATIALLTLLSGVAASPVHADQPGTEARWFASLVQENNGKMFCVPAAAQLRDVAQAVREYTEAHHLSDNVTDPQVIQILAQAYPCRGPAGAKNIAVQPKGEYATIDTKRSIAVMRTLGSTSEHENDAIVNDVEHNSSAYPPPVFFALAGFLYKRGDEDDAIFWFNAGRLRGNFDALRCTDPTARSAIPALVSQMPNELRKAQFSNLEKLKGIIANVIRWDETTPNNYDHRWINLHGMAAINNGLGDGTGPSQPLTVPKENWEALAEQAREEFRKSLEQAIEIVKKAQK